MDEKRWKATGLLSTHWGKVGGRDALARLTGIQGTSLSGYNTGRLNLGEKNARKIADALDLTLLDLGAPVEADPETGLSILRRLEAVEEDFREGLLIQTAVNAEVRDLLSRVQRLERRQGPHRGAAGSEA